MKKLIALLTLITSLFSFSQEKENRNNYIDTFYGHTISQDNVMRNSVYIGYTRIFFETNSNFKFGLNFQIGGHNFNRPGKGGNSTLLELTPSLIVLKKIGIFEPHIKVGHTVFSFGTGNLNALGAFVGTYIELGKTFNIITGLNTRFNSYSFDSYFISGTETAIQPSLGISFNF